MIFFDLVYNSGISFFDNTSHRPTFWVSGAIVPRLSLNKNGESHHSWLQKILHMKLEITKSWKSYGMMSKIIFHFLKKWTFFPLFSLSHFQNNAFPSCLGLGLTDSSAGVFKAETNIKVRMAPVTWILLWFVIENSRMLSKSFWSTIFYGFPAWDLSPFKKPAIWESKDVNAPSLAGAESAKLKSGPLVKKLGCPVGSWDRWLHLWLMSPTYKSFFVFYYYPLITPLILTSWQHPSSGSVVGLLCERNAGWWFCWGLFKLSTGSISVNIYIYMYTLSILELPPSQDSSHHQDSPIFSRESQAKPSFVTGILGGG